jgi:carbon dioxide concentrating mechanism protein CcmM
MTRTSLSSETVAQVRYLLEQGYKIGTEHVDERRFRTGSWTSCSPIATTNISEAIGALEACVQEHSGEYIRLFGIEPKAKRRVVETIIQRPNGQQQNSQFKTPQSNNTYTSQASNRSGSTSSSQLGSETVAQVRQLLTQGYKIGTEHVDERRFRTGSWQSCSPIATTDESGVIAALEECCANHQGEYVRMIGIDPKAKRRVLETMLQRPDGKVSQPTNVDNGAVRNEPVSNYTNNNSTRNQRTSSTRLSSDVVDQLRQLLTQGYRISAEHVDERRFRTGSWASCSQFQATNESEAISSLESVLREYEGEYVRLVGIDPKAKRRVLELVLQRPNQPALR